MAAMFWNVINKKNFYFANQVGPCPATCTSTSTVWQLTENEWAVSLRTNPAIAAFTGCLCAQLCSDILKKASELQQECRNEACRCSLRTHSLCYDKYYHFVSQNLMLESVSNISTQTAHSCCWCNLLLPTYFVFEV